MMGNTYCAASVNVTLSGIPALSHEGVNLRFNEMNGSYSVPYLTCGHFDPGRGTRKRVHVTIESGLWVVWFEYIPAAIYFGEPQHYFMKFRINPLEFTPCDPSGTGTFDIAQDYWNAYIWEEEGWIFPGWTPPLEGTAVVSK